MCEALNLGPTQTSHTFFEAPCMSTQTKNSYFFLIFLFLELMCTCFDKGATFLDKNIYYTKKYTTNDCGEKNILDTLCIVNKVFHYT